MLLILLLLLKHTSCQDLEIRILHEPILLLKLQNCFIQTGTIKLIHPINITNIETNVNSFLEISRKIDQSLPMSNLIIRKSKQLLNNLYEIKPIRSNRHKRWDIVGKTWKWIAGSPDADDLRLINSTFNNLIDQSNEQIKVNHAIDERIAKTTEIINQLVQQQTSLNTIILKEMDAITLLLSLDTMNNILEDIEDTILRAKVSLPTSKLLTLKEIFLIASTTHEQGIQTNFPEEALNYAKPKVASHDDMLLYILEVPKTDRNCQIIKVLPLVINDTIITGIPGYIVKAHKKLYTTISYENPIQQLHEINPFSDRCILPIIFGLESHCNVTKSNQSTTQTLPGNKILINNAENQYVESNCGPHNRSLTGNYLLTFQNCTVKTDNQSFTFLEMTSDTVQITGSFPRLSINKTIINQQNISTLTWHTLNNRHRTNHIQLTQFEHGKWLFGIFGGFSLTTLAILAAVVICLFRKRVVIKLRYPKTNNQSSGNHQLAEDVQS